MRSGRVLVVTSTWPRWPGDETTTFVRDLTRGLTGEGWEATVLAPHAPGARRRELDDGIDVRRFRYLRPESAQTVCYGSGALANLRERRRDLAKVPALIAAEYAALAGAARRVDVVHAHWVVPQGFLATAVPRPWAAPVVTTVHGGDVFALDNRPLRAAKRFAVRRSAAVTVNSSATERAVADLGPHDTPVHRIPMGVDTDPATDPEVVAAIRRRHRRGDGPLCVFVGRVVAEKGVLDLVEAMAALAHGGSDATLLLVGEGHDRSRVDQLATRRGVADRVTSVGWVDPTAVPDHLAAADIVTAPSRTSAEGWVEAQGLSIVEALAAARPVVATATGGIADAVRDGETGILVPEGDPRALAEALADLAADAERAAALAAAGRKLAVTEYAAASTAQRLSAVLAEAAGRGPGAAP